MKLRTIILILSLLAFLSTIAGGSLYYSALKRAATEKIENQGLWHAESTRALFEYLISTNQKAVRGLAGLREIKQVLAQPGSGALDDAHLVLDDFNAAFEASVCYLMDRAGDTIASSNRLDPDSFIGNNYAFRPYFQKAIQGEPYVYMALGVTSGLRGIYYSHAVYTEDQNTPAGVIVMKSAVDSLEKDLLHMRSHFQGMITMITGPRGLIFMSDSDTYRYQLLEQLPDEKVAALAASKQFGRNPLKWSGFRELGNNRMADASGEIFIVARKDIQSLPGWQVVHLHNADEILSSIFAPLARNIVGIVITLCVLVGMAVTLLYAMARSDIARRKAVEAELVKSETRYRSLVESSSDHIFMFNCEGVYLSSNTPVGRFNRPTAESRVGRHIREVYPEKIADLCLEKLDQVAATGQTVVFEYQIETDGETRHRLDTLYPIDRNGQVRAVGGIGRDITAQKEAEKKLRRNETVLNEAQRIAHLGAWVWNMEDNSEWWSDEQFRIFGYEPGQVQPVYGTFIAALHPEDKERVLAAVKSAIQEDAPYDLDFRIVRPDGDVRFVSAQGHIERSPTGKPVRMAGTVHDVTLRKTAESALKENEEKFRSMSASINDALLAIDDKGMVTFWNDTAEKIFGHSAHDVLGRELHPLLAPPRYLAAYKAGFEKFRTTGKGHAIGRTLEMFAMRKDGTEFPIELSLSAYHFNRRWHAVGTIRDISDRKAAEQEKEKLIGDLQDVLKRVRQLSGLLPICAHCKKIRDDKGYWSQIETFIQKHSDAEFSHSICKECAEKYYPDMNLYED